jgi:hypothetical protein
MGWTRQVTRKCGKPVCDNAASCAADTERAPPPSAARRAKARTPKPRRSDLRDADPTDIVTAPPPPAPAVEAAPAVATGQSVKTGLGEVHWQKREEAGILDGRESLFIKIWNAISSFRTPKAPVRPKTPKKRPEAELDPYADLFG